MDVNTAKIDLAKKTKRGISNIIGGVILWTVFGILGLILPETQERALIYLFGAGLLFPIGLLIGFLLKLDMFAKGNNLSTLGGMVGGLQILFIPVILGAYYYSPETVPWFLAVLVGAHLLPFSWIYKSKSYLISSISISIIAGLSGWLFPNQTYTITPFLTSLILFITVISLYFETRQDKQLKIN